MFKENFMKPLDVAYLKLDLAFNVLDYNNNLKSLFNMKDLSNSKQVAAMITDLPSNLLDLLNDLRLDESKSLIIIKNNPHYVDGSVLFLYTIIQKAHDSYIIRIVNWLNWIHELHGSVSYTHDLVANFDNRLQHEKFSKISKAACFKVFYPLITHVPDKFIQSISQASLFSIMHLFIKTKNDDKYSKDYARNLYVNLRNSLKHDYAIDNTDIFDILQDSEKLPIRYEGNIQIPKTTISQSVAFQVNPDNFLTSLIDALYTAIK